MAEFPHTANEPHKFVFPLTFKSLHIETQHLNVASLVTYKVFDKVTGPLRTVASSTNNDDLTFVS